MNDTDLSDLVTLAEAARLLDMTPEGIWIRIKRGRLRSIRIGQFHLVKKADLKPAQRGHKKKHNH